MFLVGLAHLHPFIASWDRRTFRAIYRLVSHKPIIILFRALWTLGTTPAALIFLVLMLVLGDISNILIILFYGVAITIERIVKLYIKRPRPFAAQSEIVMRQPRRPNDPSFPSGDAVRVWFLIITFSNFFELPGYWYIIAFVVAFLITIGRIAMGVHYPLDVIGGAGLGIFFAGMLLHFSTIEFTNLSDLSLPF
jgi:membrane-associated phospholipid phosphatase